MQKLHQRHFPERKVTSIRCPHPYNSGVSQKKFLLVHWVVPGPGKLRASNNKYYYTKLPYMCICTHYYFIMNTSQTQTESRELWGRQHMPGMSREDAFFNSVNKRAGVCTG